MDLICPICGEPVDHDELHTDDGRSYSEVARAFRREGCTALGYKHNVAAKPAGLSRAMAASAMYDILGEDMDGAASMFDDLGM